MWERRLPGPFAGHPKQGFDVQAGEKIPVPIGGKNESRSRLPALSDSTVEVENSDPDDAAGRFADAEEASPGRRTSK